MKVSALLLNKLLVAGKKEDAAKLLLRSWNSSVIGDRLTSYIDWLSEEISKLRKQHSQVTFFYGVECSYKAILETFSLL